MASSTNITGQLDPGVLSLYVGYTVHPELSQATTGVALSVSQHNLGLVRVSPNTGALTNPLFGNSQSYAATTVSVALNVQTAPTSVTASWIALFDMNGVRQAVTANGGVTAWSTGYQTFNWVVPAGDRNLVPGALYYLDVVNNASGTAPKLTGIATLAPEVNGALAANGVTPFRWAQNTATPGTTPPVVGTSTLNYASNTTTGVTGGFFAGLL
jgi:hypothetical protein